MRIYRFFPKIVAAAGSESAMCCFLFMLAVEGMTAYSEVDKIHACVSTIYIIQGQTGERLQQQQHPSCSSLLATHP